MQIPSRRPSLKTSALGLIVLIAYCIWLWQPQRQVLAHQENFLEACEDRNWDKFQQLLADNFSDQWGHNKESVVRESREVLRQFFALTITAQTTELPRKGVVSTRLMIGGNGTAIAEFAKSRVNTLRAPFEFTWTSQSWKPWDWKLTRVENRELTIPDMNTLY